MEASLQVKNGYYYAVINYTDETGKTKYKWIATGLKERGNKREANQVMKETFEKFEKEFEEKRKYENRAANRVINVNDAESLFADYCLKYIESRKSVLSKQVYYTYKTNYMKIFRGFLTRKSCG